MQARGPKVVVPFVLILIIAFKLVKKTYKWSFIQNDRTLSLYSGKIEAKRYNFE